jgi:hypothetical protein
LGECRGWLGALQLEDRLVSQSEALQAGGGVDFKTGMPWLGFRAELRNFVTSAPELSVGSFSVTDGGLSTTTSLGGGRIVFAILS